MVPAKEVVVILDVKTSEVCEDTRDFLRISEEEGFVVRIEPSDPKSAKSVVVTTRKVYVSPISSITLKKRAGYITDPDS